MNKKGIVFLLLGVTCSVSAAPEGALMRSAKSLLRPQKFPIVFKDLPFHERVAIKDEGYENYDSEFDKNCICISGCAYPGMTIEEEKKIIAQATQEFNEAIEQNGGLGDRIPGAPITPAPGTPITPAPGTPITPVPGTPITPVPGTPITPVPGTPITPAPGGNDRCPKAVPGVVPPLKRDLIVVSDFGYREVSSGTKNHKGIDLRAAEGTSVYAAAGGTLYCKSERDGYGNLIGGGYYAEVNHGTLNGKTVKTKYLHLMKDSCKCTNSAGCSVEKNQQIALSGGTPSVTPHLDYRVFYGDNPAIAIDPLGSEVAPYYEDNGVFRQWPAQPNVFLSAPYRFKPRDITSIRVKGKTEAELIRVFPCCLGYSNY